MPECMIEGCLVEVKDKWGLYCDDHRSLRRIKTVKRSGVKPKSKLIGVSKLIEKECPVCKEVKPIKIISEYCSNKCRLKAQHSWYIK